MSDFTIIIPARYNSTRLPNKMLLDVNGMPLIVRVAKQATKSNAKQVIVATDHKDILNVCLKNGINVILTSKNHLSGTDRISEAARLLRLVNNEIILNVQGDEPLIDPQLINQLANFIITKGIEIATAAYNIESIEEAFNPNIVKVVLDSSSNALYFSRASIPFYRDGFTGKNQPTIPAQLPILHHIGIYAYKCSFLQAYTKLAACELEKIECLEQLRALYYGYKIGVMIANRTTKTLGVDTIEDLQIVRQIIKGTN